jgi:hypothetical protein
MGHLAGEWNRRVIREFCLLPVQICTGIAAEGNVWIMAGFSNLTTLLSLLRA